MGPRPLAPTRSTASGAVFHSVLEYAVQTTDLSSNPLHKVKWTPPKTSDTVDPRVVVNPMQAASLLSKLAARWVATGAKADPSD